MSVSRHTGIRPPAVPTPSKRRIFINYPYTPWSSYRYCEDALATFADVTFVGQSAHGRIGRPASQDVPSLAAEAPEGAVYLSADTPLQEGIPAAGMATVALIGDYWHGDYARVRFARLFDHVFVGAKYGVEEMQRQGVRSVQWMPFACDPRFHRDLGLPRIYEVGFVGFTNLAVQSGRLKLLQELAARYRMNDFLQPTYLEEMAKVYSQSKIVVNIPNQQGFNMRVFEAMACGALLVTERLPAESGQDLLFAEGRHLVTYADRRELYEKVDFYLAHPDEADAIRLAGQREVLAKHTYRHRMREAMDVIARSGAERHRSSDRSEILQVYAVWYSRTGQIGRLARGILAPECTWRARLYVAFRLLWTVYRRLFERIR